MCSETTALLTLVLAGGPAAPRRALLDAHGSAAAAVAAGAAAWRTAGLSEEQASRLRQPDAARLASSRQWLEGNHRHQLLGWHQPAYPPLLRRLSSPPLALFVDGDPDLLWHPAMAVVGSRAPTAGGRDNAHVFARAFAAAGLVVVSGLASGIDAAAHQAALAVPGGKTVAVLGTGPDLAYPAHHASLRERIATRGAVVSEHPPGTPAKPSHFPGRNRLIAGLGLGTLVVEAAERSGALITARQAADAGREVFAIPGSIHNPLARGCHRLIRDGAGLAESPAEVMQAIGSLADGLADALRQRLRTADEAAEGALSRAGAPPSGMDPDYQNLWRALGHDPTSMDCLVERTGLTPAVLSSMLLVMELEGRVTVQHGRYARSAGSFHRHGVT